MPRSKSKLTQLSLAAKRAKLRRANESQSQREERLKQQRETIAHLRSVESKEEREERLKIMRIRQKSIRSVQNGKQRRLRLLAVLNRINVNGQDQEPSEEIESAEKDEISDPDEESETDRKMNKRPFQLIEEQKLLKLVNRNQKLSDESENKTDVSP